MQAPIQPPEISPPAEALLMSDPALFLGLGLLDLVADLAVRSGADVDGRATLDRLTASVRLHAQLARAFRYGPTPQAAADEDFEALIAHLQRMAPVMPAFAAARTTRG